MYDSDTDHGKLLHAQSRQECLALDGCVVQVVDLMQVAGWEQIMGWSLAEHDLARGTARAKGTARNINIFNNDLAVTAGRLLHTLIHLALFSA